MEYRALPHGAPTKRFSTLGLGLGGIQQAPAAEIRQVIETAIAHGINFFDLCAGAAKTYAPFGQAIRGCREQVFFQLHLGFSSHTPAVAQRLLDTGLMDMIMFSINPAYDLEQGDEFALGSSGERAALFRRCQAEGVGISVMKPFFAGSYPSRPYEETLALFSRVLAEGSSRIAAAEQDGAVLGFCKVDLAGASGRFRR